MASARAMRRLHTKYSQSSPKFIPIAVTKFLSNIAKIKANKSYMKNKILKKFLKKLRIQGYCLVQLSSLQEVKHRRNDKSRLAILHMQMFNHELLFSYCERSTQSHCTDIGFLRVRFPTSTLPFKVSCSFTPLF